MRLRDLNYKCVNSLYIEGKDEHLKYFKNLKISFSDKNYILAEMNSNTMFLKDNREDLMMIIKCHDGDFSGKSYGFTMIVLLDSQFNPIFSIHKGGISKYRIDNKLKKNYYTRVKLNKKIKIDERLEKLSYDQIITIFQELKKGNYKELEKEGEYFFYEEGVPLWTENVIM